MSTSECLEVLISFATYRGRSCDMITPVPARVDRQPHNDSGQQRDQRERDAQCSGYDDPGRMVVRRDGSERRILTSGHSGVWVYAGSTLR